MGRQYLGQVAPITATIANGQTTSGAIDARGLSQIGLVMPSAFTGTTISFNVSADGATYQALYDATNTLVSVTVAASRSYALPSTLLAWPYFKIVSGSAEAAARTLTITGKG